MIKGQSLTYLSKKQEIVSCEDFCYLDGVTYLPYRLKAIFTVLSLPPFVNGYLSVNDVQVTSAGFVRGTARAIKLDVSDIGSLLIVLFNKESQKEANQSFQKLVLELKMLRSEAKTEEDKKNKVQKLITILSRNPVSYILIDLNDPLVQENRVLWETKFRDFKGSVFFLSEDPQRNVNAVSADAAWSKSLFLPYRIPIMLTSFLAIFFVCYAQSLKTWASSIWGLVFMTAILFLIGNIVINTFLFSKILVKEAKQVALISSELLSASANAIGIAVSLLMAYLLSSKTSFFSTNVFEGFGLAAVTLTCFALFFSQFIAGHAVFVHCLSKSKFPGN
jgi:hypothetical protein